MKKLNKWIEWLHEKRIPKKEISEKKLVALARSVHLLQQVAQNSGDAIRIVILGALRGRGSPWRDIDSNGVRSGLFCAVAWSCSRLPADLAATIKVVRRLQMRYLPALLVQKQVAVVHGVEEVVGGEPTDKQTRDGADAESDEEEGDLQLRLVLGSARGRVFGVTGRVDRNVSAEGVSLGPSGDDAGGNCAEDGRHAVQIVDAASVVQAEDLLQFGGNLGETEDRQPTGHGAEDNGANRVS